MWIETTALRYAPDDPMEDRHLGKVEASGSIPDGGSRAMNLYHLENAKPKNIRRLAKFLGIDQRGLDIFEVVKLILEQQHLP